MAINLRKTPAVGSISRSEYAVGVLGPPASPVYKPHVWSIIV